MIFIPFFTFFPLLLNFEFSCFFSSLVYIDLFLVLLYNVEDSKNFTLQFPEVETSGLVRTYIIMYSKSWNRWNRPGDGGGGGKMSGKIKSKDQNGIYINLYNPPRTSVLWTTYILHSQFTSSKFPNTQ